jgi:hypothetical protein
MKPMRLNKFLVGTFCNALPQVLSFVAGHMLLLLLGKKLVLKSSYLIRKIILLGLHKSSRISFAKALCIFGL